MLRLGRFAARGLLRVLLHEPHSDAGARREFSPVWTRTCRGSDQDPSLMSDPQTLDQTRTRPVLAPDPTGARNLLPHLVPHPPALFDLPCVDTALLLPSRRVVMGARGRASKPPLSSLLLVFAAVVVAHLSARATAKCLARLDTHPAEFDECKRGTHCFLFLAEPPMVIVDGVDGAVSPAAADAPPGIRSPFNCTEAEKVYGLTGASFDLHSTHGLWPSNKDLCVYAGGPEECTFTAMIAYLRNVKISGHPAYGMALGAAGMLVHVAHRLALAVPSTPIYEVRSVPTLAPGARESSIGETGHAVHGLWATTH